jgi:hypothetical protein
MWHEEFYCHMIHAGVGLEVVRQKNDNSLPYVTDSLFLLGFFFRKGQASKNKTRLTWDIILFGLFLPDGVSWCPVLWLAILRLPSTFLFLLIDWYVPISQGGLWCWYVYIATVLTKCFVSWELGVGFRCWINARAALLFAFPDCNASQLVEILCVETETCLESKWI